MCSPDIDADKDTSKPDLESRNENALAEDMSLEDWTLEPLETPVGGTGGGTAIVGRNSKSGLRYEYTFASSLVKGIPHPPFIQEEIWKAQKSALRFREGDVFVCTYSKCGTTLAEQVVLLLLNGGEASGLNPLHKNTHDRSRPDRLGKIWTEMAVVDGLLGEEGAGGSSDGTEKACMGEGKARMSADEFDALASPRVLKTHAPREIFLAEEEESGALAQGVKVIYVTRNPFDACVSCYYHPKPGVSPHSTGCPFDAFAKLWLSDRVEFGGWANHVSGWRRELLNDESSSFGSNQILWISYESLVRSPTESIRKIADFLDVNADEELVARVARGCDFDNVKRSAMAALASGSTGDLSHLRKGRVGDWKNHFSDDLKVEFEAELCEQIEKGLDLEYDVGESKPWKPMDVSSDGEGDVECSVSE